MAQKKITDLPSATTLTATAVFPVVQNVVDYQVNLQLLQNSLGIYTGSGEPTVSAPDGSIYLRSDSTAGAVLYVHAQGMWFVGSTPPAELGSGSAISSGMLFDSTDSVLSIIAFDTADTTAPYIIGDF